MDPNELIRQYVRAEAVFDPSPMDRKLRELFKLFYGSQYVREIQAGLTQLGYSVGQVDGIAGDNTRQAIKVFENLHGLAGTGEPSAELLARIREDLLLPPDRRPKPAMVPVQRRVSTRLYSSYLRPRPLAETLAFYQEHREIFRGMERIYGVPGEVAAGILRVETHFGKFLGNDSAMVILSSMALCSDFSHIQSSVADLATGVAERRWLAEKSRERGDWAYNELKALITYARANQQDPFSIPGSIYGAIGICQFMPSNAVMYGIDGSGDGRVDLFNIADAIYSIGCYLRGHGWTGDMTDPEKRRQVIYLYNRSDRYVNTVLAVADHLTAAINK